MGGNKTGLVGTIGVTLLNPDGTVHTARAIAGIYEIGGGCYGKEITFPDNWKGSIKWDTGGGSPVYATEDYDVEGLIDMIEEDTSKMNFTGDDIKATLDGEKVALSDATEGQIDDIETDLNTPDQYKADISALATSSALTTHDTEVKAEVNDNEVKIDNLQTDLDNPNQYKADVSALALEDGGRIQNIEVDTNEMQGKLPNDKIAGSSDATSLESKHGVGSWLSAAPTAVAAAVWNALHTDHQLAGSMGEYMTKMYNAAKKIFIRAGKP